jgi:adenylate cyclase
LKVSGAAPLAVRIGLASGPACVGNMGSTERFDYSVLGETVNIASRAEGICKRIGHDITIAGEISERTATLASLFAGKVPMKGKTHVQPIHALMGDAQLASSDAFKHLGAGYMEIAQGIAKARGGKVSAAIRSQLGKLANQHPAMRQYLETIPDRIEDFRS